MHDGAASFDAGTGGDLASATDGGIVARPDLALAQPDLAQPDLNSCQGKTVCGGNECGMIPTGCGTLIDCGDCGGAPGETCITYNAPQFRDQVRMQIDAVKQQHPEYFDFANPMGDSVMVVDPAGFVAALVANLNGLGGVVAIVDPNDNSEIRIRAANSTAAENYHVVTSKSYSAYKYTSTCDPAGF
jgi:hypothetical protein